MTIGIYCIEHVESGKKYVGKSIHIQKRINIHKHYLTKPDSLISVIGICVGRYKNMGGKRLGVMCWKNF